MSFRTEIRDVVSGCGFEQLCVGVSPSPVNKENLLVISPPFTIIDRYEFIHTPTAVAQIPSGGGEFSSKCIYINFTGILSH